VTFVDSHETTLERKLARGNLISPCPVLVAANGGQRQVPALAILLVWIYYMTRQTNANLTEKQLHAAKASASEK
jgi:hypothetical protein